VVPVKNYIMITKNLSTTKLNNVEKELKAFIKPGDSVSIDHGKWLLKTEQTANTIETSLKESLGFADDLFIFELGEDYYVRVKDTKAEAWLNRF
jgi:hypothetical protein